MSGLQIIAENREASAASRRITVAVGQLGGPWLDPDARLDRVEEAAKVAKAAGAHVISFPETYVSGYPIWISRTNGAVFDDEHQKRAYAQHLAAAITLGDDRHRRLEQIARDHGIRLIVGITERGAAAARGSTWATALTIDPVEGTIGHHRKLVATYDERLVWSPGDGAGLTVHQLDDARIGALNCWENWMSPARSALAAQGESVHVSLWPGSASLTTDITRFIALESRVFSVATSGIIRGEDVGDDFVLASELRSNDTPWGFDGGSAIAAPDGRWLIEPQRGVEGLLVADLDLDEVDGARLTFDPTGHYSRSDVFRLSVDRRRHASVNFLDSDENSESDGGAE